MARVKLTARDLVWLRLIGRLRVVEAALLAVLGLVGRFGAAEGGDAAPGPSEARITRRLADLRRSGLVEAVRIFAGPWGWRATARGLAAAGVDLRPATVDHRTYCHDIDCGYLLLELEEEFGADRVLTEREIVAHDRGLAGRVAPEFCCFVLALGGPRILRVPDLAVRAEDGDGAMAVELERAQKSRARLAAIARLYSEATHLERVRWYCSERARPGVERAIERLDYGSERMEVLPWRERKELPE
jgi:hypothetical protein